MFSEKFWSQALKSLSAHGPNALVFPILFVVFLYAIGTGIDPSLALAALAATYGAFLWGQSSRQSHLERMAKVEVDKIVATRATVVAPTKGKAVGEARK